MVKNFQRDLSKGKEAERVVFNTLSALYPDYTFEDISDQREYRRIGDIKAINNSTGVVSYFEVKNDSVIHNTGNINCEEEVYYNDDDRVVKGFMYNDYQYYCILSAQERKIYIIDFKILQENYKKGQLKIMEHYDQMSYCYLLPIGYIKKLGGLIKTIEY